MRVSLVTTLVVVGMVWASAEVTLDVGLSGVIMDGQGYEAVINGTHDDELSEILRR
jgi:hypothetical protein